MPCPEKVPQPMTGVGVEIEKFRVPIGSRHFDPATCMSSAYLELISELALHMMPSVDTAGVDAALHTRQEERELSPAA